MSLNLLGSFGNSGVQYDLLGLKADVIDTDFLSKYFVLSEFNPKFTAGKNSIAVNGSAFLAPNSEIIIECIDSAGVNLFIEMARSSDTAAKTYAYKEATSYIFSIHVYNDTADGVGKLILYGTLSDGRNVRWTRNITIDKTLRNVSKVRFYRRPEMEVASLLVPIISTDISTTLIVSKEFDAVIHGLAVNPPKDTNYPTVNRRNIDIDYRLVVDSPTLTSASSEIDGCNSQMVGSTVNLVLKKIQAPFSTNEIVPTNITSSFIISNVYNNRTIQASDPYFFTDTKGNSVVTNIVSASATVTYPFVAYNNSTASYLTTNINGVISIVRTSYADISYKNLRTFSGFIARHKIYRKSLLSNADFTVIADEPLFINEILRDNVTQNKFYELLGKFYNTQHVARYWFTSSTNLSLVHSPDVYVDSAHITVPDTSFLSGSDYLMVKNDSVASNRNATYVPFDKDQFLASSGSSYDSNFMELKANVQYILQVSAVIEKDDGQEDAKIEFYFTSSLPAATKDPAFTSTHGIKLATLTADKKGINKNFDNEVFVYIPTNDLFGTLVIVPYKCQAYLKYISLRVYGDDGFSPDLFETRIPWSITVANESFEIRAELFDINHNLVYQDLRVLQNFDPSGSSLIPFIPGGGGSIIPGTTDMFVSGNLFVSKSVVVEHGNVIIDVGNIFIPFIGTRPSDQNMSASRMLSVRGDGGFNGEIVSTPIVDLSHNDQYIFLGTGSLGMTTVDHTTVTNNPVLTRKSIVSQFDTNAGRRIYYVGGTKHVDSGSLS